MIEEFEKEITAAKIADAKIKNELKNKLFSSFKELFKNQNLVSLYWTQYTPFFNDGEECLFNVHEIKLIVKKDFLNLHKEYEGFSGNLLKRDDFFWVDEENKDETIEIYQNVDSLESKKVKMINEFINKNENMKTLSLCNNISKIMQNNSYCEQMLKDTIGDHSKIIITRDGEELSVDIESYNHD